MAKGGITKIASKIGIETSNILFIHPLLKIVILFTQKGYEINVSKSTEIRVIEASINKITWYPRF